MRVRLAYGHNGIDVDVPADADVLEPVHPAPAADEAAAVVAALRQPAAARALAGASAASRAAVVFPDLTRPFPHRTVLPVLLGELAAAGVPADRIQLLCATGTHRQATPQEMTALLGPDVVARYAVHDHDATDAAAHVEVGTVDGAPILIDRAYVDADLRIVTGFVEPHFFAGFSGGPKAVCPGLAATETVLEAHSPRRIADSRSTWLRFDDNPVHDFVRRATALVPPHLALDVAIDGSRRVTRAIAAPLPDGHRQMCAFVGATAVRRLNQAADVVVTSNAGHPLDRNLYQAVKGMAAAERLVVDGGTIVVAAACVDGLPEEGDFGRLLREARSPADLLAAPRGQDSWQVQVLGRVLLRARVLLHCDGIDDQTVRAVGLEPARDLDDAVRSAMWRAGSGARVAVLPSGPLAVGTVGSAE